LDELGVEASAVLQQVGIDARILASASNRLPFDVVGRLLAACATASGCPHFGLLLGIRSGAEAAGVASDLARHAATVRDGLRQFIEHLHLHDRGGVAALNSSGTDYAELSYFIHYRDTPGMRPFLDASMAVACCVMRSFLGPLWAPSEVTLAHVRPRHTGPYRAFFRAPLRFDAPYSALVFPAGDLDRPIAGSDPDERNRLSKLVAELEATRPSTTRERALEAISRMMMAMPPSGDRVAQAVGIGRRRLRERLAAEGTSVKQLLEEVRCELARQLLDESHMPIGDIASALHYSKPGAFSRAFKRWTGRTPRQWRKSAKRLA
jgi:AraC-like DNA-binding protein